MGKYLISSLAILLLATVLYSCVESRGSSRNCPAEYENPEMMVEDALSGLDQISVEEFDKMMESEEMFILLDVRTAQEHNAGYIPGSVLMPRGVLEFRIANEAIWEEEGMYVPRKEDPIVIYCKKGNRSALAAVSLKKLGYNNILVLNGGWLDWKSKFPENVESNIDLNAGAGGQMVISSDSGGGC
jgi:rhodanese-related sulfurtransferase